MKFTNAKTLLASQSSNIFDIKQVRKQFPILEELIYDKPMIYLDSAATSQKPQVVIDAMSSFFLQKNANVHRGVHYLSERATNAYEDARVIVQKFLNAKSANEIIYVRNTTDAINMVAQTYGKKYIKAGDEVLITVMEHHSNIVPWQMLCHEVGAHLRVAPINDVGELLLDKLERLITRKTKLIAIAHVSNVLGTINPIKHIVEIAHANGAHVLIDGAQAIPHLKVDVQSLDCDFYVFSGHKMYGPTGIGVLYVRHSLLEEMPPYQGGSNMILSVSFDEIVYNTPPHKFEAGTPNIVGAVGLAAAINFLTDLGQETLMTYEQDVLNYSIHTLAEIPRLRIIGAASAKTSVISFVFDGIHSHDVGTILDRCGISVRVGHHCAQPLMNRFNVTSMVRMSIACYNTIEDIDALIDGLKQVSKVLK